jgi:hypothetical protein
VGKVGCHEREELAWASLKGPRPSRAKSLLLIGRGQEGALRCVNTGPAQGLPTRAWRTASRGHHPSGGVPARVGIFIGKPHDAPPKRSVVWTYLPTNVAGARQSARPTKGETPPWRRRSPIDRSGSLYRGRPQPLSPVPRHWSSRTTVLRRRSCSPPLRPTRHHARPAVVSPPECPILPARS